MGNEIEKLQSDLAARDALIGELKASLRSVWQWSPMGHSGPLDDALNSASSLLERTPAYAMDHMAKPGDLPPHPDTARPQFYAFADDEMSTERPEEWLDNACFGDGVHVVEADAFRRLPKRYFVWAVNQDAERREDRQKILLEATDKAEAERVADAARAQEGGAK